MIGTDEHGGSVGQIFELSGEDGSTIRTINAPDTGGTGTLESFGSYVGGLADLGSCNSVVGANCTQNPIGGPDGVPEVLVTALGVDVPFTDPDTALPATLIDAGRAYVIDGATARLKRVQMPVQDLDDQLDAPGGAKARLRSHGSLAHESVRHRKRSAARRRFREAT